MFFVQRPTSSFIDRFVDDSRNLELSYESVGVTRSSGPPVHEFDVVIGRGSDDFARAKRALMEWKQFDIGWVELHPHGSPITVGTNVAVLIKHLGFWSLNGCRVIYQLEESPERFGFAYGTLPTHGESGEELFEVFIDRSGEVCYRIRATSEPQLLLARLGQPYVKMLQARFRRDSAAAMKRAASSLAP
jgi:uncharacterized protein (UPF0548 family)